MDQLAVEPESSKSELDAKLKFNKIKAEWQKQYRARKKAKLLADRGIVPGQDTEPVVDEETLRKRKLNTERKRAYLKRKKLGLKPAPREKSNKTKAELQKEYRARKKAKILAEQKILPESMVSMPESMVLNSTVEEHDTALESMVPESMVLNSTAEEHDTALESWQEMSNSTAEEHDAAPESWQEMSNSTVEEHDTSLESMVPETWQAMSNSTAEEHDTALESWQEMSNSTAEEHDAAPESWQEMSNSTAEEHDAAPESIEQKFMVTGQMMVPELMMPNRPLTQEEFDAKSKLMSNCYPEVYDGMPHVSPDDIVSVVYNKMGRPHGNPLFVECPTTGEPLVPLDKVLYKYRPKRFEF